MPQFETKRPQKKTLAVGLGPLSVLGASKRMCGRETIVKYSQGYREAFRLRCRAWTCAYCAPRRRGKLIRQGIDGNPNTIITLTLHSDWAANPEQGVKVLSRAWSLIRKRDARKRKGKPIPFLAVVELTKGGTPHLHIICRSKWMDQKWLSNCMAEIADAPIVHIKRIDHPGRVSGYCAKYISKDTARVGTNKRYWQSADYPTTPKQPKTPLLEGQHWGEVMSIGLTALCAMFKDNGAHVEMVNENYAIMTYPP